MFVMTVSSKQISKAIRAGTIVLFRRTLMGKQIVLRTRVV